MPELDFKGKEFVRNHHLTVPYRPLVPDASKSVGEPDLDGNLIIHGDNLEALKALMPKYAGKVDCIFIDPPYNTGNEGWCYNDNVNSPMLKAWFSENPVGVDDGLRHDKWCCMMWPRLKLLQELLKEHGTIWVTIDDVEVHRLRSLMDEVFGTENFVATVCWQKKYATANDTVDFSDMHDFVLVYANNRPESQNKRGRAVLARLSRTEAQDSLYKNPDNDPRGPWMSGDYTCNKTAEERPGLYYPIIRPKDKEPILPTTRRVWAYAPDQHEKNVKEGRLWWGEDGLHSYPRLKRFLSDVAGTVASTWWTHEYAGHTDFAKKELKEVFSDRGEVFATPKPTRLLDRVLELAVGENEEALVLDSFAGSGTTAHAILKLDRPDVSFILVECEDYADSLTAERVRRVIKGYPYKGTQRETLFERKLTWSELKRGETLREEAENTKKSYEGKYDNIAIKVEDGTLKVIGERDVEETAPGLGGTFTYCTLGAPLKLDEILKGEGLPSREDLGDWLLYVAGTGAAVEKTTKIPKELAPHFLAKQGETYYWLLYRPDKDWLRAGEAALTLDLARAIAKVDPKAEHRVFAPQKFLSNKILRAENLRIEFAPIPFALFRRGGE